jgi:hypothetical protein
LSTGTSCALNPINEKTRTGLVPVTNIEKFPFSSVVVPDVVPLTTTFIPGIGELSSALVTVPVSFFSCARVVEQIARAKKEAQNKYFIRLSRKVRKDPFSIKT